MSQRVRPCLLERLAVGGVALHSLVLGGVMLLAPARVLAFGGWEVPDDLFFASQSGIFLMILGGAYAAALWHRPFVWFLIGSKLTACAFLYAHGLFSRGAPFSIMLLGAEDACMGLLVWGTVILSNRAAADREGAEAET